MLEVLSYYPFVLKQDFCFFGGMQKVTKDQGKRECSAALPGRTHDLKPPKGLSANQYNLIIVWIVCNPRWFKKF